MPWDVLSSQASENSANSETYQLKLDGVNKNLLRNLKLNANKEPSTGTRRELKNQEELENQSMQDKSQNLENN